MKTYTTKKEVSDLMDSISSPAASTAPWTFKADELQPYFSVVDRNGRQVIRCGDYDEYNECTEEEARLIACAPAMYELIKCLIPKSTLPVGSDLNLIEKCKAVVAKVEGK